VAETVSTNQFKNGMHIELDGDVWRIVEFQHVKPGKGGAFVRTKVKALGSGAVVQVPLFVNVGDRIKLDPRERRYISRA
jgi:translation elongation factor P/translation initiation factor 5A